MCSLVFLLTGGVAGGLLGHMITIHQQRQLAGNQPPQASAPLYEELPADSMSKNPVYGLTTTATHLELESNEAYGCISDSVN